LIVMRAVVIVGLMLLPACHTAPGRIDKIAPGDRAPSSLEAGDGQVVVGWIVRESDCLACITPAYELRRLLETKQTALMRTVVVGESTTLVEGFLLRERLPVDIRRISEDVLRQEFGAWEPPFIVVTYQRAVRAVVPAAIRQFGRTEASPLNLDSIVLAVVGPVD
jgi:hypothetical protein